MRVEMGGSSRESKPFKIITSFRGDYTTDAPRGARQAQGGSRMKEQIKEILLKQLQLLQEKSEKTEDATELAALTVAMSQILNSVDKMQTYGYLD